MGSRPAGAGAASLENLPADRPLCEHCGKGLGYWSELVLEGPVVRKRFIRWKGYPESAPMFHSLRCALEFAANVVRQRRIAAITAADRRAAGG
jgi:hypothetical protein